MELTVVFRINADEGAEFTTAGDPENGVYDEKFFAQAAIAMWLMMEEDDVMMEMRHEISDWTQCAVYAGDIEDDDLRMAMSREEFEVREAQVRSEELAHQNRLN